jgi:hypothetical protein
MGRILGPMLYVYMVGYRTELTLSLALGLPSKSRQSRWLHIYCWFLYQYNKNNNEFVTIYEGFDKSRSGFSVPLYQFEWLIITNPNGVTRDYIAYPGDVCPHEATTPSSDVGDLMWAKSVPITYYDAVFQAKTPINYHIGCMGLLLASHDFVD